VRSLLFALLFAIAAASPTWGQAAEPRRVRLTWENDLFAGTDAHYTNGLAVTASGPLGSDPLPAPFAATRRDWEVTLGQEIYTPEDTSRRTLVRDDRPYAGLAYVRLALLRRSALRSAEDRISLTLGIVGPASGASATQEFAHDLTGSNPAEGWAHQLRDEPVFMVEYASSFRFARASPLGLDVDLTADLGAALGNLSTHAEAGASLRLGFKVPDAYAEAAPVPLRCYLTASARARAVAYDLLLDGNLLRSGGHRVSKRALVAEVSAGLTVALSDRVSFSYVHTYRTPQFHGQRLGDHFGSLSLAFAW